MKSKILAFCLLSFFLAFTISAIAQSDYVKVYGEQTRGTAGSNAKLTCSGITLTSKGTISLVEGSNNGFWITKSNGVKVADFKNMDDAMGYKLNKGTYYVYPNLKKNQNKATITVYIE